MPDLRPTAASRLAGKHPLRWFTDSPEEGDPACLCSLCETVIPRTRAATDPVYDEEESYIAWRMWNTGAPQLEARFHDECFEAAQRAGVLTRDQLEQTRAGAQREPRLNLGKCCFCESAENVRNVLCLPVRSPDGKGWGCMVCGLPAEGATAVLCDPCLEAQRLPRFACLGFPSENRRVPVAELTTPFLHDQSKHAEREAV